MIVFTFGMGKSRDSDGNGLRGIGDELTGRTVWYRQWEDFEADEIETANPDKLILIGHSFGGSRAVKVAAALARPVDHLILLDPVPMDGWGFLNFSDFKLSGNVRAATCYYRPALLPPWSSPIRKATCPYANNKRLWGHNRFCSDPEIRAAILDIARGIEK